MDIGTNSVRLLVADVESDGGFLKVFEDRRIARLGQGLQGSGELRDEAIGRALESLHAFLGRAAARGAKRIFAVALIVGELLKLAGAAEMVVSDYGLLEGMAIMAARPR